jgi:hypothetical protein
LTSPITPGWLWAQHAEHRIPLAKLIWLGVLRLTHYDFLVGDLLSVVALATMAFVMIRVATRLRGAASISDAVLPLAVLNLGQTINLLWWWQVNHLIAPIVAMSALLVVVTDPELSFRRSLLLASILLLLPFSGPDGLPYTLALGLWLGSRGVVLMRSSRDATVRFRGILLVGIVSIAYLAVGAYFVGYSIAPGTAAGVSVPTPDARASLRASLEILSLSLGPAARPYWKFAAMGLLALMLVSIALLGLMWRTRASERTRVVGLLLFTGGLLSLFLVLGRARAGLGDDYIWEGTYVPLAVPALCVVYFVFLLYARPALARGVHFGLLLTLCVLIGQNADYAGRLGDYFTSGEAPFEKDVQAGVPAFALAERHLSFLASPAAGRADGFGYVLSQLRQAGITQFRNVAADPTYREVSIPASGLVVSLDRPRFVYGARIVGTYADQNYHRALFQIVWSGINPLSPDIQKQKRVDSLSVEINPGDVWDVRYNRVNTKTLTMWISDVIDRFTIVPDNGPIDYTVSSVTILVPPDE